jgi:hypothetical protein
MAGQSLWFYLVTQNTALGRTPLDGLSDRRRDLYLTSHNIQKRHIHACGGIRTRNPSKRQSGAVWIGGLMDRGTCTRFLENRRISFFLVVIWSQILRLSVYTHTHNTHTHRHKHTHSHTYNRRNKKFVKEIISLLSFKSCTRYGHVSNIYRLTFIQFASF